MKFAKKLFLYSVFALGTIGLTACGGDSSSSADEGDSSSSAEPLVLSSVSETSPLDKGSKLEVRVDGPDKDGNYQLSLSGIIKTDSEMFPDPEGYDGEDPVYYNIDSLQFDVGDKNGNRVNLPVSVNPAVFNNNADRGVNLVTAVNGEIKLDQDAIGCGEFTLYVTIFMSGDTEDTKQFQYTARKESKFQLQCKVIESSSAAATCTEMEKVGPVTLSNKLGDSQFAINFATGAADSPDVTMVIEDGTPFFDAGTGVEIVREGSQETGVIPSGQVCMESFSEAYNGKDNHMELEQMGWYLIKTASGTYAVMIDSFMRQDETRGDLTIVYFKKK